MVKAYFPALSKWTRPTWAAKSATSTPKISSGLAVVQWVRPSLSARRIARLIRSRAKVAKNTDAKTLQKFVADTAAQVATVYTDDAAAYKGMPFDHASVRHSVGVYVDGDGSHQRQSSRFGRC